MLESPDKAGATPASKTWAAALSRFWFARRGFGLDVLPAVAYGAVLFWAGLIPLQHLPGPEFRFVDKVWHLAAFGVLAALLARALAHFAVAPERALRRAALTSALLGGALEVLQSFTPYRAAELADLVADGLGAASAYALLAALLRRAPAAAVEDRGG